MRVGKLKAAFESQCDADTRLLAPDGAVKAMWVLGSEAAERVLRPQQQDPLTFADFVLHYAAVTGLGDVAEEGATWVELPKARWAAISASDSRRLHEAYKEVSGGARKCGRLTILVVPGAN